MVTSAIKTHRYYDYRPRRCCRWRLLLPRTLREGSVRSKAGTANQRGAETELSRSGSWALLTSSPRGSIGEPRWSLSGPNWMRATPWPPSAASDGNAAGVVHECDTKPIFVVGSINADIVVEVERLPEKGETLSAIRGGDVVPGGKGANQAAAAALLGYPTYMVGQVGQDAYGTTLAAALGTCQVHLDHVVEVQQPSGQAIVMLQPGGENSIIVIGGANRAWAAPSDDALDALEGAGGLLLQREVPEEVNLAAAKAASASGALVVLDAGGDAGPLSTELLQLVDVLSPNETELARLTGMPTETTEQVKTAAAALLAQGVKQVLVKMGSQGSLLVSSGTDIDAAPTVLTQNAIPAPKVVDTTGAGDTFTAAFIVATLRGYCAQEALQFAAAAASLCVQKYGAQPSLPTLQETAAWLVGWEGSTGV